MDTGSLFRKTGVMLLLLSLASCVEPQIKPQTLPEIRSDQEESVSYPKTKPGTTARKRILYEKCDIYMVPDIESPPLDSVKSGARIISEATTDNEDMYKVYFVGDTEVGYMLRDCFKRRSQ